MLCIGGTQVEVYMKHIMERTLTFFRMALSTYLQTAVGYILEIFVSEKKKMEKCYRASFQLFI